MFQNLSLNQHHRFIVKGQFRVDHLLLILNTLQDRNFVSPLILSKKKTANLLPITSKIAMRTSQSKRHSISTLNYNALIPHMSSVGAESQNNSPNEKQDSDKRKRHTLPNNNDYEKSANQHSWELLILTKHTIVKYDFELPSKIPSNKNKVQK